MSCKTLKTDSSRKQFHISVRNLVEFILREGDLDNRRGRANRTDAMLEGTRIHKQIQSQQGPSYMAEVPLSISLDFGPYDLIIDGRADGIFPQDSYMCIDEIKGMYKDMGELEQPYNVHLAQAKCYAYLYGKENALSLLGVRMTYCNLDTNEKKYFNYSYPFEELEEWFRNLTLEYKKWTDFSYQWRLLRQTSIKNLEFPFPYREGQKKLVTDVYRTIVREKILFLMAPTGVGKTISTVFPAVKAVGEDKAETIFYLTAKTITASVALDTFAILNKEGYRAKLVQLTAKEKLCFCQEMECNPAKCPYAKGHFDRVNDAVFDLLEKESTFTRELILEQAEKYQVCPFEMSLDLSSFCDVVICDYNYVFDLNVRLKRFFGEGTKGDYIFLVDEAHNLVDRSRDMYSAAIYKEDFLAMKHLVKPYSKRLEKLLDRCNRLLLAEKRRCQTYLILEEIGTLYYALLNLQQALDAFLEKPMEFPGRKDLLDFYFSLHQFLSICDLVDQHYVIYSQQGEDGRFGIKLFCVDPSYLLQQCLDQARSTIFFSATLLPVQYYKKCFSTREDNYAVYAQSTFSPKQSLLLIGQEVSTKYNRRNPVEFEKIALYLEKLVRGRQGNYMAFFPSYKLMDEVWKCFLSMEGEIVEENPFAEFLKEEGFPTETCASGLVCMKQKTNMSERERELFLEEFNKRNRTMLAFCLMGGIFGEGIDLKEDSLIGAAIVGTGLPQVSYEREILKNYYEEKEGDGFDYAYRFPGLNKVLQAAGRVIRTSSDRGVILLLDQRFLQKNYQGLYPKEWEERSVTSLSEVEEDIRQFWEKDATEKKEL